MSFAASRSASSKENLPTERASLLRDVINDQQSNGTRPRIKGTDSLSGRVAAMVLKMERKPAVKAPMAQQESLEDEEKKRTKRRYMGSISGSKLLQNIFRKEDRPKSSKLPSNPSRVVAVSGAAAHGEPMVFKDPGGGGGGGCLDPVLRRSKTSADANSLGAVLPPMAVLIGSRLKKRQSESSLGGELKARRLSFAQQAVPPPPKLLPRPHSAVEGGPKESNRVNFSSFKDSKRPYSGTVTSTLEPKRPSSLKEPNIIQEAPRKSESGVFSRSRVSRNTISIDTPSSQRTAGPVEDQYHLNSGAQPTKERSPVRRRLPPAKNPSPIGRKISPSPPEAALPRISITPAKEPKERSLEQFDLMWRQNRGLPRGLSRTMTYVESKILPPLYETAPQDDESTAETIDPGKEKKKMRRYGGSHTTSTYQGRKDTAPDASPRRHLIGFLHRTSHLSLTSELSGNASFYLIGHRGRRFEDSTLGSESDARIFSDEDDRGSTTTDITSVSRQQVNAYRRRQKRRNYRKPSRASSFSSITESSMSLDVITVTLNMDPVNFLGISIIGESSTRGDNGIYVANIIKGGAVALDGRIEAGDMILQVNDISFENFTNDQAVEVLKDAVQRKGPIKLTVAKSFNQPKSCFTMPRNHREEPVRPIDTQAWIAHTNAMRAMPSIMEVPGSEGAPTPVPGDWPHGRPPSSSTVNSGGSGGQNTVIGRLTLQSDRKRIVQAMAMPDSGLEIKNRHWLKIDIPNAILGSDLIEWLLEHVDDLRDKKDAKKLATELLKMKLITHMIDNQMTFIEQRYYGFGPECADFIRYRTHPEELQQPSCSNRWQWGVPASQQAPASMVSGYASMPVSPFPHMIARAGGPDVRSQASGGSGEGSGSGSDHRRRPVLLPPAPPSSANLPTRLDEYPMEMAASRQSFRQAMNQPFEYFVDHL